MTAAVSSELKQKVPTDALRIGMYVCELDRPWLDSPFLLQGFPLQNSEDIRAVQEQCTYVFVDVERSTSDSLKRIAHPSRQTSAFHENEAQRSAHSAQNAKTSRSRTLLKKLVGRHKVPPAALEVARPVRIAEHTVTDTTRVVRGILDDVRLGRAIDTPQAKEVVARCVDQVIENRDALLLLTNIKDKDEYTSQHSLNVSILSIVLGHRLGLPRDKLEELGLCGLLHDVGKILTPDEILKKPGRLTEDEILIMKMHPTQGRDLLLSSDGVAPAALDVAHGHHERFNGSGYPRGLTEEQLSLYTRIVAVTDTFDAITSDRVYGSARTSIEALKILQAASGSHYDGELVSRFLDAVGVFPPGSVVQLSNGEVGVVVRANPKFKLLPKVLVLKNAKQQPITPRYEDLAQHAAEGVAKLHIAHMVKAEDFGVDVHLFRNPGFLEALSG